MALSYLFIVCQFDARLFCHAVIQGKLFKHMPLFTKQYKLTSAKGNDALKLKSYCRPGRE